MSAEGKKKRGESGMSNAKNIPFRYHGYPRNYTLSTALGRPQHPRGAGSLLVRAMNLGVKLGGFAPSQRLLNMTEEAMLNCTHEDLT